MISVKFTKDFADKFKGDVVQFTEQLASYLVNVDKVAIYLLDKEAPKAKEVKPKTKK